MVTGLDIVDLLRFEQVLLRTPEFGTRYFTAAERQRCARLRRPLQGLAATFAAKEALLKALGVGVLGAITLDEIELDERDGHASLTVRGAAADAVGTRRAWVSTACDGQRAWAVVVLA